jgi:ComF family protein
MNKWPRIIQNWLYPPTCLLCGDPGQDDMDLCAGCARSLPRIAGACRRCGIPLYGAVDEVCGDCQRHPPPFHQVRSAFLYREPVDHLICALKYGARYSCARLLGTLLAGQLADVGEKPDVILPVPLHSGRYRERGFNQSIEIARVVSRRLEIPLDFHACRRIRATVAQAGLRAKQRRQNLRGAFATRPGVAYRHVAILDDVMTTGTTARELTKTLLRAGVERVQVWTCARTL